MDKFYSILHTEASLGWGGQEIRILEESKGLRRRGHKVIIACQPESKLSKKAEETDIEVIRVSMGRISYLQAFLKFRKMIDDLNIDILNTHSSRDSWLASIAGRISRKRPIIIRTRHLSTPISRGLLSRFLYEGLPHRVITTGEEIRRQIIEENGFDESKIVSIPTGVDINLFDPEKTNGTLRKEWGIDRDTPVVGMVAVIRSWKGHEYFIDAAEKVLAVLPEVKFIIVGDGPRKDIIREYVNRKRLQGSVIMTGHRDDIPQAMASIDLLALPSYANEGLPQSVAQAMAMEKAVVASKVGSITELVIDGMTGYVVQPKNTDALAERMVALLEDKELRKEMGKAGRRLVLSRLSLDAMLDRIENLYSEVMANR